MGLRVSGLHSVSEKDKIFGTQMNAIILKRRHGGIFFVESPALFSRGHMKATVGTFCSPTLSLVGKIFYGHSTSQFFVWYPKVEENSLIVTK